MAAVQIAHRPELTVKEAMEVFTRHFGSKYRMDWGGGREFVMRKTAWTGVRVALEQRRDTTRFVVGGVMPSVFLSLVFGGLIGLLFLRRGWKAMEQEALDFIQNAAEFR